LSRGGASLHLEEELIHNRLSGTRGKKKRNNRLSGTIGGKKRKKKRGGILHLPPLMAVISVVIQVQTPLVPMILPHLFQAMSDLKPFPMMSLTMKICAHIARWSIRLVVMIHKIHRFLFSFANIDFADNASRL